MKETKRIYLCKPGGVLMGVLTGVNETGALLKMNASDVWELTCEVDRYITSNGDLIETDYYSSLNEMMELFLETDDGGVYFQIDEEPQITVDGKREYKSITAHSIEKELATKFLKTFKINCGTDDSLEHLVGYYNDNDEFINMNLNPYTNLPIDYIVVKNEYATDLVAVKEWITQQNLDIDSATGMIQNLDLYPQLLEIYEKYPRISSDIYPTSPEPEKPEDVDCRVYMTVITDNGEDASYVPNPTGYNIRVGSDGTAHTKQYLIDGIENLIHYYEVYGSQLSLLDLIIEKGEAAEWSAGYVPVQIRNKKYTFNVDNQDILSFLRTNCTSSMKVLFDFDRLNRQIGIVDIGTEDDENLHDTGVFLTYKNLINTVNVKSSSQDGIRTRFYPTGANGLNILYANFGENYITDLSWLISKINEYGEYQYVSEDLHDKYNRWIDYRLNTPVTVSLDGQILNYPSNRDAFRELTRIYNQYMVDIDKIKNKLPNDGCKIDYTTFTFDELNLAYKAYANALSSLITLYKTDVGAVTFDQDTLVAKDAAGNDCTNIKDTFYWLDFACYKYTIIPNVMKALAMYVRTQDETCTLKPEDPLQYDAETGEWIECEGGNPWYNGDAKRVTENMSDAFVYDMSLYGTVELQAKQNAWRECAATLYKVGFVLKNGAVVDPIPADGYTYNTPDDTGWNKLSTTQKEEFTDKASFMRLLNEYLDYVSTEERDNALTKAHTKGVIQMAQDAIDALQPEIDALVVKQDEVQEKRKEIADNCSMENFSEFTLDDITLLNELVREADYSNNNILTTNLDDVVTTVDAEEDLYQDAVTALYEKAQPQLSFEISTDNLFALEDFKPLVDYVQLFNFIRICIGMYKDEYVKLRIIGIEKNPLIPTADLTLSFSNMTYSLDGISDLAYLFQQNGSSSSSGGGGSSSSSGGGNFGDNDAEIQIANNMLNALLRSKTATTGITQVMIDQISSSPDMQNLLAESGTFSKLETGDLKVSGNCLVDFIKSSNYNGTGTYDNTYGSYINLKTGTFNLGGGSMIYDNDRKLKIKVSELTIEGMEEDIATAIDEAKTEADEAKTEANDAKSRANTAYNTAVNAAKTATNYLNFSSGNGLIISQNAQSSSYGYNTQIVNDAIKFRYNNLLLNQINGDGMRIYESYGTNSSNEVASFLRTGITLRNQVVESGLLKYKTVMECSGGNITITGDMNVNGTYKINNKDVMLSQTFADYLNNYFMTISLELDFVIYSGDYETSYASLSWSDSKYNYVPLSITGYKVKALGERYTDYSILGMWLTNNTSGVEVAMKIQNFGLASMTETFVIYVLVAKIDKSLTVG